MEGQHAGTGLPPQTASDPWHCALAFRPVILTTMVDRAREALRAIPSVDRALRELGEVDMPRPIVVRVTRRELDSLRARLAQSPTEPAAADPSADPMTRIRAALKNLRLA